MLSVSRHHRLVLALSTLVINLLLLRPLGVDILQLLIVLLQGHLVALMHVTSSCPIPIEALILLLQVVMGSVRDLAFTVLILLDGTRHLLESISDLDGSIVSILQRLILELPLVLIHYLGLLLDPLCLGLLDHMVLFLVHEVVVLLLLVDVRAC